MKHYFNIDVAKDVGVNAAIIFENIYFWINHNANNGKNFKDGEYWTYATQKDIAAQFEYLSVKQCRTALERLEAYGYIKTGSYNKHGYDRTTWYALTEKSKCLNGNMQMPSGANGEPLKAIGFDVGGATIPDIIKDNNKNNNIKIKERAIAIAERCGIAIV